MRALACTDEPTSLLRSFITTKIAFANAIADVADRTPHADKHAILHAIGADGRVGHRCLAPGFGFGGPCFPRDNRAFGLAAAAVGAPALLCDATDRANRQHAQLMAEALLAEERDTYTLQVRSDIAPAVQCPSRSPTPPAFDERVALATPTDALHL